ncbi:protein spaetzle 4 [Drosophila willistoni]|nr:protein spaetzle 4 [Drosophila willistoni]
MLAAIPCDLGKQAFCNLPGSAYPWHAVRRFVHENQGLMKRMYGDVRHISILRDEIQNNEVDMDDMEDTAERYSKDGGARGRNAKYLMHGREKDRDRERDDFVSYKGNDVLMEPHFRPVSVTAATTTTTKDTTTTSAILSNSNSTEKQSTFTTAQPTKSTKNSTANPLPALAVADPETNSVYEKPDGSSTTASPKSETNKIGINDSLQLGLRNLTLDVKSEAMKLSSTTPASENVKLQSSEHLMKSKSSSTTTTSKTPFIVRRNITRSTPPVTTPMSFSSFLSASTSTSAVLGQRRPLNTSTPAPMTSTAKPSLLREGQLFQDAMKQEPVSISSNMRGVNACPVKDEVVAPFWANNTRGEVLALLNLYPFEQYVHWEKCTQEFKQMFCRDGCRCEQQYRLHRLLAYDPHNECRGIFSDWFRFPSSCICKCYNIPMEFRATSRSPRSESSFDPNPIETAEAQVQRAIYEHATDDWYRPRDEFDYFEG